MHIKSKKSNHNNITRFSTGIKTRKCSDSVQEQNHAMLITRTTPVLGFVYLRLIFMHALPVLIVLSALGVELHWRLEAITLTLYVLPQDSLGMPQLADQDMHVPKGPSGPCTVAV